VIEYGVDDAGAVEGSDHGHAARDRRGLVAADFLQSADIELDVRSCGRERIEVT